MSLEISDMDVALLEGSAAFLSSVVGADNWQRLQQLRQQSGVEGGVGDFFTWLLEAGEERLMRYQSGDHQLNSDEVAGSEISAVYGASSCYQMDGDELGPATVGCREMEDTAVKAEGDWRDDGPRLTFGDDNYSDTTFFCHACNIHLNKMDAAHMHLAKVHPDATGGIAGVAGCPSTVHMHCTYCDTTYSGRLEVAQFFASHGARGCPRRLTCKLCHKPISTKSYMKVHMAKHRKM